MVDIYNLFGQKYETYGKKWVFPDRLKKRKGWVEIIETFPLKGLDTNEEEY